VLDGKNRLAVDDSFDEKPLSLEQSLILANQRNEQLGISGETYVQALIAKQRAFSAFLPTISLAPAFTYLSKPSVINTTGNNQLIKDVPITGTANLFNGFRDAATLEGAGYTAEQRKAQLLDLQATIFLDVAQTYYQVLSAERSVLVLTNSVKVQDANVADIVDREHAGVARPLDVAQAQAQDSSTRADLITARENVKNSRTMLAYLIDAPVQNAVLVDQLDVPSEPMPIDSALEVARDTRQDVVASRQAVEAARQEVVAALGQWYPSVSIDMEYFLQRESVPTASLWEGFLDINLPLFDSGNIYANVRTAWSQLRVARLTELMTVRQADELVKTAYDTLIGSRDRVAEFKVEVKAASDALYQSEQSYKAGVATYLDELTSQDQLLTAQLSLATEELNYKFYYLQFLRSMGLLLRPDHIIPTTLPTTYDTSIEVTTPSLTTAPASTQPGILPFPSLETQPGTTQSIAPYSQPAETQPTTSQPEQSPPPAEIQPPSTQPAAPLTAPAAPAGQ
jgi:outer membrane protein TolC